MCERIYYADLDPLSDLRRGHQARYFLARGFLRPFDRVIDAACGCGGGSQILAGTEKVHVTGFDYSEKAIAYAKKTYTAPEIEFVLQDLDAWKPAVGMCDVAVSFESIEHLENPAEFARKLKLSASRMIIMSAPVVPTVGINPHHHHDFTEADIEKLFQDKDWVLYEKFNHRVYGVFVWVRRDKAKEVL